MADTKKQEAARKAKESRLLSKVTVSMSELDTKTKKSEPSEKGPSDEHEKKSA